MTINPWLLTVSQGRAIPSLHFDLVKLLDSPTSPMRPMGVIKSPCPIPSSIFCSFPILVPCAVLRPCPAFVPCSITRPFPMPVPSLVLRGLRPFPILVPILVPTPVFRPFPNLIPCSVPVPVPIPVSLAKLLTQPVDALTFVWVNLLANGAMNLAAKGWRHGKAFTSTWISGLPTATGRLGACLHV